MTQQKPSRLAIRSTPTQVDLTAPDALHLTTLYDQVDNVLKLLESGADVDLTSPDGWTALQVASAHNRPAIAEILLKHGADTETKRDGSTALHMAATKGHSKVVTLLLKYKAEVGVKRPDGQNALHLAARCGRIDVIRSLAEHELNLEEPCDDRAFTALHIACEKGYSQCATELLSAGANSDSPAAFGYTPLMIAAIADHLGVVMVLLDSGADIDANSKDGRTGAMVAAHFGSSSVLKYLISSGANLNVVAEDGSSALSSAISQDKSKTALLLLEQRVHVNRHYGEHKSTALHLAVHTSSHEVVEALIAKGADLEACDVDGDAPLQWAVQWDKMALVKILLRKGSQLNKRNEKTGETVLHWAVKCGLVSMTQALLAHGSDPSLLDLDSLQKREHHPGHEDIDDEDFETCKVLVETASLTEMETHPPEQFQWPLEQDPSLDAETLPQEVTTDTPNTDPSRLITNPIYQIKDQVAAEAFIAQFQDKVVHDDVKCTGPHCTGRSDSIRGVRYKCTLCDTVNLCSTCIGSFFNNHEHHHPMVRCLLPTHANIVTDIDENTRMVCELKDKENDVSSGNLKHIVCATTDALALRQLQIDLSTHLNLDWSEAASLLTEPETHLFAMWTTPESEVHEPRLPGILTEDDHRKGGLDIYKIDGSANVRMKTFPVGEKSAIKEEEEQMFHHDVHLLADAVFGKLKRFNYGQDELHKWAWDGRQVTRLIDLKPGVFDDKIEIELRVVDLAQTLSYEALSYTWKETAYERALISNMDKEVDETLRSIYKLSHGVYCHDVSGKQAFLTVNTGLRDALKRLRDPHKTKTFWIDQLAINQQDLGERAFQVRAMTLVYNRAQRVVVWTGDEDMHTEVVFDLYKRLAQVHLTLKPHPSPQEFMQLTGIAHIDQLTLKAMFEFFQRPVFGRSWCIQEIVVGQKVIIKCGDHEVDWVDIWAASVVLSNRDWLLIRMDMLQKLEGGIASISSQEENVRDEGPSFEPFGSLTEVIQIAGLRQDFQASREVPLETLLYATSRFQASEAKDKVYAVLGIRGATFHIDQADDIQPDYKKSDAEVFTAATKFCIQQSNSMHICGMSDTISRKKIVGLPSWVPDYTRSSMSSLFAYCRPGVPIPYNACGDVPSTAAWPYEQHGNILVTSSCPIETIDTFSENHMSNIKQFSTAVGEWSSLIKTGPDYPTGDFIPTVFLSTCFTDSAGKFRQRPPPDPVGFWNAMMMVVAGAFVRHLEEKGSRDMLGVEAPPNNVMLTIVREAFESFPRAWGFDGNDRDGAEQSKQSSSSEVTEASSSAHNPSEITQVSTDEIHGANGTNGALTDSDEQSVAAQTESTPAANVDTTVRNGSPQNKATKSEINPDMHAMATQSVVTACFNRKFFITGNHYFGLGPRDMQKGDEIHILSGTKVPFVMRRITDANANLNNVDQSVVDTVAGDGLDLYQMVGECYVHGYMQGEVMSRDDLSWDGIAIC